MKKKAVGLVLLFLVYALASILGVWMFVLLKEHMYFLVAILIADVIATVFVWGCGVILKTASTYDPYWSLQTFVIYIALLFHFNNWSAYTIIPLIAIGLYSARLTANFIAGFHDLSYVDWRYKMLKEKSGKLFQVVNLFGICMFPTIVVYAASVPLFIYSSNIGINYGWVDFIGSAIIFGGTLLELISDLEMKKFIKIRKSRDEVINIGLWKYSRHPNYLGEISIWFGVAFILIFSNPTNWYYLAGAFINLIMFMVISIPMEEKHMKQYKPLIVEYIETTSMLLILPKKRKK